MNIVSVFNHKGGVGKTTVTYNLACRLAQQGSRCLIIDADPQCNITAMSLPEQEYEAVYNEEKHTIATAVDPLVSGAGDIESGETQQLSEYDVAILPGDILLVEFESLLPNAWTEIFKPLERGFRSISALYRIAKELTSSVNAEYTFFDLGPNVGALNQSAILASDYFLVPVTPDLYSLRAVRSVGKTVRGWVEDYSRAVKGLRGKPYSFEIPTGLPKFAGYIAQQFGIYRHEPTQAFKYWVDRLDSEVQEHIVSVLDKTEAGSLLAPGVSDTAQLARLKNYHSLVPKAQEVNRPIFGLKAQADVRGEHITKAKECGVDFDNLISAFLARVSEPVLVRT